MTDKAKTYKGDEWFSSTSAICREASSSLEAYKESLISARDRYLLLMNAAKDKKGETSVNKKDC